MINLLKILPIFVIQKCLEEVIIITHSNYILTVMNILKKHAYYQYKLLSCISGVDLLLKNYRFSVVYDLLNVDTAARIRIKTFLDGFNSVESVQSIFYNANWWEREIWDMFGIKFLNHPDLRRILTDYGFEGYPLRKDFPLSGYVEVYYDEVKKRINMQPLNLSQKYRNFCFKNPWE